MFRNFAAFRAISIASLLAAALSGNVSAQEYPARAINIVVPYVPGTLADVFTRALAEQMAPAMKQNVVVENRPGAFQVVASSYVSRMKPDGYTLMTSVMPNVAPQSLRSSSSFVPNADLDPVGFISALDMLLAIPPSLPVSNLEEFFSLIKASPGKYSFGSAGVGTPHHMMLEMLNQQAGLKAVHVPYASFQNIITQVSTGQLNYSFLPPSVMQFVNTGKMKVLATTAFKRDPAYSDVKTLDEMGIKGLSGLIKFFIVAPKGLPADIQGRLNVAINTVISSEGYAKRVQQAGGVTIPSPLSVAEVVKQYIVEDKRFDALVKDGAIKLD